MDMSEIMVGICYMFFAFICAVLVIAQLWLVGAAYGLGVILVGEAEELLQKTKADIELLDQRIARQRQHLAKHSPPTEDQC